MAASRMLILRRCKQRRFFPSPPSFSSVPCGGGSIQTSNQLVTPHPVPAPSLPPASSSPIPFSTRRSKNSVLPLAVFSTVLASSSLYYYHRHYRNDSTAPVSGSTDASTEPTTSFFYSQLELFNRILSQMRQTGLAAAVLWQSLKSVMTSAEHEVRLGFSLRVASLLADIAAANQSRRKAIVGAGGGKVVDWLLDTVAFDKILGTQDEAARALAYLIADQNVVKDVLGRPNAVPNLLRFIFSCQPKRSKQSRRNSFDISDSLKGRSMLVTAIMDIVTSSCDSSDKVSFQPYLTGIAETRDIAAAIEVIEEGGMDMDGSNRDIEDDDDDDDGGIGVKGIGMKVLGGTTVVGLSRTSGLIRSESSNGNYGDRSKQFPGTLASRQNHDSLAQTTSDVVPGLWDDLISEHVAVPFAAWALANWSVASDVNRTRIHELDRDGYAILNALLAPERSVKFHGSLAARSLLEDHNLPLNDYVADWSCSLLSIVSQGSKNEDIPLVKVALSAFFVSVDRSRRAQKAVMDKGLHLIRESATCMTKYTDVQESLARVIELLCTRDTHLSLLESQKWSGILLKWIFGKQSSEITRSSAANILSCIFEDYGSSSIPISQGWLTLLLNEILSSKRPLKGSAKPKSDKVQTQIDQLNIASAGVVVNQLAGAVVSLGSKQSVTTNSDGHSPLSDFLSLEPFAGQLKGSKTANLPKLDAADSAVATLKGVKMLTELCSEDSLCQNKIVEWGVLCLLRRLLLRDDYENLAATEAYDASRDSKFQERGSSGQGESSSKANDSSNVRVPPTAHIRRHAARLLTILSLLPKVQKVLLADKTWCRWLEDCANGKISGCDDLKIRSYARATLLNVSCNEQNDENSGNNDDSGQGTANKARNCPRFSDMILLVNPEMPHWKLPEETEPEPAQEKPMPDSLNKSSPNTDAAASASLSTSVSEGGSQSKVPLVDIVFVHGIQGGPFKTWRITDDKSSTKSGFVEKIDQEAGKEGTFWPGEWLPADFHHARLFTLKYKTNLTQWSGASLPLQEVSSMLLEKLAAAGIGERPVVFVTHSMGGLLVKQMLYKAKDRNIDNLVNNTIGIAFYTCPHFGSKLADVPWRMGLVFRPAPSVGELRSGCSKLVELNDFVRQLHKNGQLDVLSFCETKVTPIVEGYGGWAFRMEIVPIESAYPGFGELVVLESTDHINSCKPLSHSDPSYTELLKFLHKLKDKRDEKVQGSSVIV